MLVKRGAPTRRVQELVAFKRASSAVSSQPHLMTHWRARDCRHRALTTAGNPMLPVQPPATLALALPLALALALALPLAAALVWIISRRSLSLRP